MAILECKNLTKRFGATAALQDVSLEIAPGRIIGLLGPNGSGKTTLLKLANGLLTPDGGTLAIDGMAPGVETKKIVSYLPEKSYLAGWMNVRQLLGYFSDFYADFQPQRALEMLARLDIDPNQRIKTMSKGTQEKVQLILVMSRAAKLYLLDEPIGGVDPAARDYILDTIIRNYSEDAALVLSTHLIGDIEKVLDDVVMIGGGRLVASGSVDELRAAQGKSVDAFFREVFKC